MIALGPTSLVMLVDAASAADVMRAHLLALQALLREDRKDAIGVLSYEQLAMLVRRHDESPLADWIDTRIAAVFAS